MKKYLIALTLPLLFLSFSHSALAAQACPGGTDGECTDVGNVTYECDTSQKPYMCVAADTGAGAGNLGTNAACTSDGQCGGNLACIHGTCQIDPSLEDTGTSAAGGACNPTNNNNDCPGGQTCNAVSATQGFCDGATGNASAKSSTGFVPLVPIPGLTQGVTADQSGLATFLNNLYKYLIGLAAVLAVIQIIRGGLEYATQDSVSKKDDGKHHIQQALFGLVLILSPVLIFSLINPSILNLGVALPKLNTAAGNWAPTSNTANSQAPATDSTTGCTVSGTFYKKASCPTSQAAQDWVSKTCASNTKAVDEGVASCQTENSSGCTDKTFGAYCGLSAGPYIFIDTSQSGFSFSGIVNAVVGYSHYEPVAKSNSNPNNGTDVVNFASTCVADGGTVCLSDSVLSTSCSYNSSQSTSQSNTCYSKTLECKTSGFVRNATSCSANPNFTVIQ